MFHTADQYLQSFRAGEECGFSYFFNAYYDAICSFAARYVKDIAVAEEIAEDGFMAIWKQREKLITESGLKSYLYKTVYHASLRWLENKQREQKHIKRLTVISDNYEKAFTEQVIKTETIRLLKLAIDQLPTQCRKIFFELYIEGKTPSETAAKLSLSVSTINNQKARGIRLLKEKMATYLLV